MNDAHANATAGMDLEARLDCALARRCLIVAVGNPMRGDDGAGQALLKRLSGRVEAALLDAEEVPESHLGRIAEGRPEVVLLVDAVDLGAEPGAVALLGREALPASGFSTHRPPLSVLMAFLEQEIGAEVLVLGIQPKQMALGAPLSPEVENTVEALAALLARPCAEPGGPGPDCVGAQGHRDSAVAHSGAPEGDALRVAPKGREGEVRVC